MKVHILTDDNFVSYYFFYPLLANKSRFKDLNISIKFYQDLSESLWNCDAVLLDTKFFDVWENLDEITALLESKKSSSRQIIWLDSSASTGTTTFTVLPYVDKYWKKQLLKDLSLYKNNFAGARIFTDYFNKNLGVTIENKYCEDPLPDTGTEKISISWNLGVGPYGNHRRYDNCFRLLPWYIKQLLPFSYRGKTSRVKKKRPIDIAFRGSNKYSNSAIEYQRIKTLEKLADREIDTAPSGYSQYFKELNEAKLALSPFGYGEICYRDFEIFYAGAALVKPSMDHMTTYPDFFSDGSHIPIAWDLSDFDEKIDAALSDPDQLEKIASEGQRRYKHYISAEGQEEFCLRLRDKLNE